MTKNKVFLSIVVFVGVFSLLYGYQDLIGTEEINMVDQALINGCLLYTSPSPRD